MRKKTFRQNSSHNIKLLAKQVLEIESESILGLIPSLNDNFVCAIKTLLACKGRVIVTAIGKSGHIGKKIAATLSSTGTPSIFVHPSEALHGDLGMITKKDVVIVISNSGESEEIVNLLPIIKKMGAKLIAITGREKSTMGQLSDIVLEVKVKYEADPLNLAPTASTTAALALGDAIAVVLLKERRFSVKDFAKLHPGGNIGRSLLEVKDIMHSGDSNPIINENQTIKEALLTITSKGLGVVSIVNTSGSLTGIVTDGDIRRFFMKATGQLNRVFLQKVKRILTLNPVVVYPDTLCLEAVKLMEDNRKHRLISILPVVTEKNQPVGMIHIHDLIRRGFTFNREKNLEEEIK